MASNRYGDLLASPDSAGRYGDLFERAERNKKNKFAATRIGISDIRVKLNSFRGYEPISVFGELINEVKTAISELKQNEGIRGEIDKIKDEIPHFLERGLKGSVFVMCTREDKPCAFIYKSASQADEFIECNPDEEFQEVDFEGFTKTVGNTWRDIDKYNPLDTSDGAILIFRA